MPAKKDLTGKIFGMLKVIEEIPFEERPNKKKVYWKCQCECGNITQVVSDRLNNGRTKSCGCFRAINAANQFSTNQIGKKYNRLTVIEKTELRGADGSIIWKCLCDCGNEHYASTNSLTTGAIGSCGCWRSRGESKINALLFDKGVNYQTQFWFPDLKDKKYLYFDFAILNEDGSLKCLVEYQGIQHYYPEVLHGSWKNSPQEHDRLKREYCKNHNITLIEIPYTDFEIIDWEYLKNKLAL